VPDAGEIAVIDRAARKQIASWPMRDAAANFPMAIDDDAHLVIVAFRGPARLMAFTQDGAVAGPAELRRRRRRVRRCQAAARLCQLRRRRRQRLAAKRRELPARRSDTDRLGRANGVAPDRGRSAVRRHPRRTRRACRNLGVSAGAMRRTATLLSLAATRSSAAALAYRPFDGTDAAVADPGEIEIELARAGYLREGPEHTLIAPAARFNYGVAPAWEAVLEGQAGHGLSASARRSRLVGNAALLKHVLREGSLQDSPGPSIATEFGLLLPGISDEPGLGRQPRRHRLAAL
jgi:hypothetical protein